MLATNERLTILSEAEQAALYEIRIIATLALKEMKQSTLIKRLCTYTAENPMRKGLFEYDTLICSIHTLRYLRDPNIQSNTHRSQKIVLNLIISYVQLLRKLAVKKNYMVQQL